MDGPWRNPFAENGGNPHCQNTPDAQSDEDDDDQVVYHEDYYENLRGLYTRQSKREVAARNDSEEADLGSNESDFAPAKGSGMLEVDDICDIGFKCFDNGMDKQDSNSSSTFFTGSKDEEVRMQSLMMDVIEAAGEDLLKLETRQDVQIRSSMMDVMEAAGEDPLKLKNARISRAEEPTKFKEFEKHILEMSATRHKSHFTVKHHKNDGAYNKKRSFNFRSLNDKDNGGFQRENLSLAQKLDLLVKSNDPPAKDKVRIVTSLSNVPITEKLSKLVEEDSNTTSCKKGIKVFTPKNKCSSYKQFKSIQKTIPNGVHVELWKEMENCGSSRRSSVGPKVPAENINAQLQKALLEAPPMNTEQVTRQIKMQGRVFGFAARLQKVLESERNKQEAFMNLLQANQNLNVELDFMDIKIVSKCLEARFASCSCEVLRYPKLWFGENQVSTYREVCVIFNLQTNAQLEIEVGNVVRVYSPWQEVLGMGGTMTILCTFFCEVISQS